jgi:DNA-binding HxlR family transcriptional regulator
MPTARPLDLEAVVERHVLPAFPVHVDDHPTDERAALAPVVEALRDRAHEWIPETESVT